MLKTITLENFTVFPKAELEFSPGLNVFVGENGTGKTHLLKLGFALIGAVAGHACENLSSMNDAFFSEMRDVLHVHPRHCLRHSADVASIAVTFVAGDQLAFVMDADGELTMSHEKLTDTPFQYPIMMDTDFGSCPVAYPVADPDCVPLWTSRVLEPIQPLLDDLQKTTNTFMAAKGTRNLAVLANHLESRRLTLGATLFWDMPEDGLNPKWIAPMAKTIVRLSEHVQVCIATHSRFLLQELEILQENKQIAVPPKFVNLRLTDNGVAVQHGKTSCHIGDIVSLDMEIDQANRYLKI